MTSGFLNNMILFFAKVEHYILHFSFLVFLQFYRLLPEFSEARALTFRNFNN